MKINDLVYGEEEIKEKVLTDLIASSSIQRLKGLNQFGMPDKYYHKNNFSRYDHSIGVLILLRKLCASLPEQVAGLLHDVSHTAFSHVIDWTIGDSAKEDYQDRIHKKILKDAEIPQILKDNFFVNNDIFDPENFSLLEREAPSLCADRIDYTLRELSITENIFHIYRSLTNCNGQICFDNLKIGEEFGRKYMKLQTKHWGADESKIRYHILSEVLKYSLEKKIISLKDLRTTDQEVIDLLIQSKDKLILEKLTLLEKGFTSVSSEEGIELKKKFRYVDPEILFNNSYRKLSELSSNYYDLLFHEKKESSLIRKLKIIPK